VFDTPTKVLDTHTAKRVGHMVRIESVNLVDDDTVLRKRYACYPSSVGWVKFDPEEVLGRS